MFATDVVDEIGAELHSLISDHGHSKIVLDFSNVQYVSSMMLAKLASLERHVEIAKGKLKLCGLGPVLKDTFRIGHFERVFDIYDDRPIGATIAVVTTQSTTASSCQDRG